MTALLNKLIQGYDKRLRPNFGGKFVFMASEGTLLKYRALKKLFQVNQ